MDMEESNDVSMNHSPDDGGGATDVSQERRAGHQYETPLQEKGDGGGGGHKILAVVVGIIVVVVLAGGAYAGYKYMGMGSPSPEAVLSNMRENMKNVKSAAFDGSFQVEVHGVDKSRGEPRDVSGDFSIGMKGRVDNHEPENAKQDITLTVDGSASTPQLSSDASVTADTDVRRVDHVLYARLNKLDISFGGGGGLGAAIISGVVQGVAEKFKGTWVSFPENASTTEDIPASMEANRFLSFAQEDTDKKKQIIAEELNSADIIIFKKNLGTEDVTGVSSYHYRLAIDLVASLSAFERANEQMKEEGLLSRREYREGKEDLVRARDAIKNIGNPLIDVWVGADNQYLRKAELRPFEISYSNEDGEFTMKIHGSVTYKDFNKKFDITAPEDARPLKEIMREMFGGLTESSVSLGGSLGREGAGPNEKFRIRYASCNKKVDSITVNVDNLTNQTLKPEDWAVHTINGREAELWPFEIEGDFHGTVIKSKRGLAPGSYTIRLGLSKDNIQTRQVTCE